MVSQKKRYKSPPIKPVALAGRPMWPSSSSSKSRSRVTPMAIITEEPAVQAPNLTSCRGNSSRRYSSPQTPFPGRGIPPLLSQRDRGAKRARDRGSPLRIDPVKANLFWDSPVDVRYKLNAVDNIEVKRILFQRFREKLWRNGPTLFSAGRNPDVSIIPIQLPATAALRKKKSPQTVKIRVVVHSEGRHSFALQREFRIEQLQATLPPGPASSPSSPSFNKEALLRTILEVEGPKGCSATTSAPQSPWQTEPNMNFPMQRQTRGTPRRQKLLPMRK